MKPAEMNSVASVAISTIGSFFGKYGVFDTAAREMMRASLGTAPRLSRAVASVFFARYEFEQVAQRLGLALQRAQLHVVSAVGRRLPLELVEARAQRLDARARDARIVFQRTRKALRLVADLAVELGDLRLQFLDARMVVEQRGRLLGELRAQRDALLVQPADRLRIDHVGGLRAGRRS